MGFDRATIGDDARAAVVLGVESVPDGLASCLLAGVNPVAGLYAYMLGVASAAFFTSTAYMAVQGTGAMAIIVVGVLKFGVLLRFMPNSVMAGFLSAVGINIVLGPLGDFTGHDADGSNRLVRTIDSLFHFWRIDLPTVTVGMARIALILGFRRTRLGAMGLVVAVIAGSAIAAVFRSLGHELILVGNVAEVPNSLPTPAMPPWGEIPMSATSLVTTAGARSRLALVFTGGVMAIVVLVFAGVVEYVAMSSLAGLLIIVGIETVKVDELRAVFKTGPVQAAVMPVTLLLTPMIPLQFAVLVGLGMSMILYIVRQSEQITTRRLVVQDDGGLDEVDPPAEIPACDAVVLQP